MKYFLHKLQNMGSRVTSELYRYSRLNLFTVIGLYEGNTVIMFFFAGGNCQEKICFAMF